MERGFSLSEVVVSLLLVTSISLALLKQQWHLHRLMLQTQLQVKVWQQTDNDRERGMSVKEQRGTSILELLIGLVLALGIVAGLLQQYLQIKHQFQDLQTVIDHLSRTQLVVDFVRMSVQKAGFTPCLPINHLQTIDHRTHRPLESIHWQSNDPSRLQVFSMRDNFVEVTRIAYQQKIYTSSVMSKSTHSPLIIADCYHAEVYQDYVIEDAKIVLAHPLTYTYHAPIYLGEWRDASFLMRPNRDGKLSMFYDHLHSEELLSDLDGMVWRLDKVQTDTLVHCDLSLNKEQTVTIDIRPRQS